MELQCRAPLYSSQWSLTQPCTAAPAFAAAVHCARELRLEEGGGGGGGGGGAAATVLDAVRDVLARRSCRLVCYGALEALPELLRQGRLGFACRPVWAVCETLLPGILLWLGRTHQSVYDK